MAAPRSFEKWFDYLLSGTAIFAMALMTATASFLWDLSRSVQILNSQVAVVIEQVSGNQKQVQMQLTAHEKQFDYVTDQLRILNNRISYLTNYVNNNGNHHLKEE